MHSKITRLLAVVMLSAAGLALSPVTSSAEPVRPATQGPIRIMASPGHVNSNVTGTWLYNSPYGEERIEWLERCRNFDYDAIINGRYRTTDVHFSGNNGFISTDKAGPGYC
jgi:hypothetical protein